MEIIFNEKYGKQKQFISVILFHFWYYSIALPIGIYSSQINKIKKVGNSKNYEL